MEVDAEKLPKRKTIDIEIPTGVIEQIVELSQDKEFMSLKNDDIFPDSMVLDGNEVTISVKTDPKNLSLENNLLDDTLITGIIEVEDGEFHTPLNELGTIAFETLGISN